MLVWVLVSLGGAPLAAPSLATSDFGEFHRLGYEGCPSHG